ncbi:MAG: Tfp pilus assembly protein PilN [Bacteriovoracaceae bacterium]|jgi:Tfp pilus assembly protein PilN
MIEINLLEQKKQFKMPSVLGIDFSTVNIKMLIFAILFAYIPEIFLENYYKSENIKLDEELKAENVTLKKLRKDLKGNEKIKDQLLAFSRQVEKLKKRSEQVDRIIKQKTNPKKILEKIARSVPEDLWFTKMSIGEDKSFVIEGGANSYKSIGNFISVANNAVFFGSSLSMADSKTETEKVGTRENRIETFTIKGKVLTFDPETK